MLMPKEVVGFYTVSSETCMPNNARCLHGVAVAWRPQGKWSTVTGYGLRPVP
jgi:hypothetical protein